MRSQQTGELVGNLRRRIQVDERLEKMHRNARDLEQEKHALLDQRTAMHRLNNLCLIANVCMRMTSTGGLSADKSPNLWLALTNALLRIGCWGESYEERFLSDFSNCFVRISLLADHARSWPDACRHAGACATVRTDDVAAAVAALS